MNAVGERLSLPARIALSAPVPFLLALTFGAIHAVHQARGVNVLLPVNGSGAALAVEWVAWVELAWLLVGVPAICARRDDGSAFEGRRGLRTGALLAAIFGALLGVPLIAVAPGFALGIVVVALITYVVVGLPIGCGSVLSAGTMWTLADRLGRRARRALVAASLLVPIAGVALLSVARG